MDYQARPSTLLVFHTHAIWIQANGHHYLIFLFQISAMTKSPYPLLDFIMVGPLLAFANIYFGSPVPELYVALAVAVSFTSF